MWRLTSSRVKLRCTSAATGSRARMKVVRSDDGGPSGEGVSSVEVFGFVGWITSSVAYGEAISSPLKRADNAMGSLAPAALSHRRSRPPGSTSPLPVALLLCTVLYMLWAYIPNSVLESYGIHYYPSKYWAVALPTWACVSVVAVYWAYEGCACTWGLARLALSSWRPAVCSAAWHWSCRHAYCFKQGAAA